MSIVQHKSNYSYSLFRSLFVLCLSSLLVTLSLPQKGDDPPHIVVIIADDFGWSDVGFRDPEMWTPNLDRMASEGVNMTSSYVLPMCTPSRSAFLSGIYPYKMGVQHSVFSALKNKSIPLGIPLLPLSLQEQGYATHYVGKWHLGFCNIKMTPTHRGFDSFYGMYNGKADYFDHLSKWKGYDMHEDIGKDISGFRVAWEANTTYSTHLFTQKAIALLKTHRPRSQPLFMILSYQAVHGPLQVPRYYVDTYCSKVKSSHSRKIHCAMGAAMDEGIGNVTSALERLGYSKNLITLFISDNGASVKNGGSNWPLRGSKITLWEGATRVTTLLHSKKHLPDAPYEWKGLMHAVDWYPTLMKAAGCRDGVTGVDGVDNWGAITGNKESERSEFVYNINEVKQQAAIRDGRYKLIEGKGGKPDAWYNPPKGVRNRRAPEPTFSPYSLFDLKKDPDEEVNLIDETKLRDVVKEMKRKLKIYKKDLEPAKFAMNLPKGKPRKNGGAWVTGWCEVKNA